MNSASEIPLCFEIPSRDRSSVADQGTRQHGLQRHRLFVTVWRLLVSYPCCIINLPASHSRPTTAAPEKADDNQKFPRQRNHNRFPISADDFMSIDQITAHGFLREAPA
jgi:hypothetical protein